MNFPRSSGGAFPRGLAAAALALGVLAAAPAPAATLTWGTSGTGGDGTWDLSNGGWWNGTTNVVWPNGNTDVASFGGTPGTVTLTTGITANGLTFAADGYLVTGGTLTFAGSSPTLTANTGVTGTIASVRAGSAGLTKAGAGAVVLTGNGLSTSGNTTINAGTLKVTGASAFLYDSTAYNTSSVVQVNSGGTLELDTFGYGTAGGLGAISAYGNQRILNGGTISITGNTQSATIDFQVANGSSGAFNMTTSGQTLTLGDNGNDNIKIGGALAFGGAGNITVNEVIQNNTGAGSIIKTGAGTLSFGGAMTYSGSTTINAGTFTLTGSLQSTSSFTVNSGATANINATNWLVAGHGAAVASTRVITVNGGAIVFGGSNESRIGDVTLTNGGTFTSNRGTGSYDILLANVDTGAATVTVNGSGASTMNGSGGLHLQGVQNFAVADVTSSTATDLTVSLALADAGTTGGAAGGINKTGAGTMTLTNSGNSFTGNITIGAGVLEVGGSGRLNSGGYAGAITNSGTFTYASSQAQTLSGAISNSGAIVFNSSGSPTVSGSISGAGSVTLSSGATLYFGGTSTYSGTTTIGSSGKLEISGNPLSIANSVLNVTSSAGLGVDIWAGKLTVRGLTGSGLIAANGGYNNGASWWWTLDPVGLVISPQAGESYSFGGTLNDRTWNGSAVLAIEKAGEGTQTLTTSNGYTGGTLITAGTLVASNSGALGGGGTITLNTARTGTSNASLYVNATSADVTIARPITVANQGTGTATLGSASTANTNSAIFSGAVTLAKDVRLDGGSAGSRLVVSGGIGGTGNVSVVGTTRVTFMTTANTYSGSTTIIPGAILQLSDGSSTATSLLPDGGVVADNGTLWFAKGNNSETIGGLTGSGIVQVHPGVTNSATLVVDGTQTLTFSGTIADGGLAGSTMAFTKSGVGTQILTGANTYTGATTITGGTLQLGGGAVINAGSYASGIDIASGAVLAIATSANQTLAGVISGSGALIKSGAGTLTLNASNTYAGTTTVSQGTLRVGSGGTAGSLASSVIVNNANLVYDFSSSGAVTLASGSTTGSGNLSVTARDINLGGAIALGTSGSVTITQVGAGTFPFCINLGGSARTISGSSISLAGDVGNKDADGGSLTLDTSAANGPISLDVSLGRSGVTYIPTSLTANAGTGTISVVGTGPAASGWRNTPVTLTGRMNITANVNSAQTVTLNETTATGTVSGALSGVMSLVKGGTGTLTLTAVNTYTGQTLLRAGTLVLAGGEFGSGSGNGTNRAINIGVSAGENATFTVSSGTISQSGGAGLMIGDAGSGTFNQSGGSVTLGSNGLWLGDNSGGIGTANFSGGTFTNTGETVVATRSQGTINVSGSATVSLATLQMGYSGIGVSSQTANVNLEGGTLAVNSITRSSGSGNLYFNGGTLKARSSTASFMAGLTAAQVKAGGAVIDTDGFAITIGQAINENPGSTGGGLTKLGSGTLTLSAVNGFTGPARVNAGTLAIGASNSLQSAASIFVAQSAVLDASAAGLTVVGGQTLGGYGTVQGNATFQPGGILSPGGSIGTVDVTGAAIWSGSSAYLFEVTSGTAVPNVGWDLFTTGSLSITATTGDPYRILLTSLTTGTSQTPGAMTAGNWDPDTSYQWLFVDTANPIASFDPTAFTFDGTDFLNAGDINNFSVVRGDALGQSDTDLYVVYTAVPEPGTLALAGIGVVGAAYVLRRRARRGRAT